jgi:hypothetical protein
MSISNWLEQKIGGYALLAEAFAQPETLYLALFCSDPGEDASGTEVSAGDYARLQVDAGDVNWERVPATVNQVRNKIAFQFSPTTSAWGTVTHFALFDSAVGGNLHWYGELDAPVTITPNRIPYFPAGTLIVSVSAEDYLAEMITGYCLLDDAWVQPTDLEIALWTAGGEVAAGDYARLAVSAGVDFGRNGVESGQFWNAGSFDWPVAEAAWGTITGVRIYDAVASELLAVDTVPDRVISIGDVASFAAHELVLTIA